MYYLYIKTHNVTGLKYLGQTKSDPHKYKGSGIYWKRHLKNHGNDVTTDIIGIYSTKKELKEKGIFFSKLYDVVKSREWANLIFETGDGWPKHQERSKETRKRMSDTWKKCGKGNKKYRDLDFYFDVNTGIGQELLDFYFDEDAYIEIHERVSKLYNFDKYNY